MASFCNISRARFLSFSLSGELGNVDKVNSKWFMNSTTLFLNSSLVGLN